MASRKTGISAEAIDSILYNSESSTENESSNTESDMGEDTSDEDITKECQQIHNMYNVHNISINENNLQTVDNESNISSSEDCIGNSDSDINPTEAKRNKSSIFSNNVSTKHMYDLQNIGNNLPSDNQSDRFNVPSHSSWGQNRNSDSDQNNVPSHSAWGQNRNSDSDQNMSEPTQTRTRDRPPNEIDRFNDIHHPLNSDDSVSNEPTQHPLNDRKKAKPHKRKNRRKNSNNIADNRAAYESDDSNFNEPSQTRRKAGRPKGSKNKVNQTQRNQNVDNESSPTGRRVTRQQTNPQPVIFSDSDPGNYDIHVGDRLSEVQITENDLKFWKWKTTIPSDMSIEQFDFDPKRPSGPNPEVFRGVELKEIKIYELYQTPDILENILHYTNLHGEERHLKSKDKKKGNWNPLDINDLRCVDAILAYMGIVHLPDMSEYWSNDPFFGNAYMRHLMSRDKFYQTLRSLHFTDEKQVPENGDKLYKVRNLFKWCGRYIVKTTIHTGISQLMNHWLSITVTKQVLR